MDEIWKDIAGYEGKFQVSNHGRVRRIPHIIRRANRFSEFEYMCSEKIVSQNVSNSGYKTVYFKPRYVHRIVAMAFVDGYFEGADVNHIDEDKQNNMACNLEWCTRSYNNKYGNHGANIRKNRSGKKVRPVIQMTMSGEVVAYFDTVKDAERATGIKASNICAAMDHIKRKSAGGYRWKENDV